MQDQDQDVTNSDAIVAIPKTKIVNSSHIVAADSVQAEEIPTVPLGPLQTLQTLQPEVAVRSIASTREVQMPAPLVVQPSEYRRSIGEWFQVWLDGIRPSYFILPLMPVLIGSILAWTQSLTPKHPFGSFHLSHFLALVAAVILLQVSANLLNDYYDYLRGIDTSNPLGPGGLIQQGLIRPVRVLYAGMFFLLIGGGLGLYVASSGGWLVMLGGLLVLLCAYFYSGTNRALSSILLGEPVVFAVFGPLLTLGAFMIQTHGRYDRTVLLYSLPLGLLAAAVIHINNMRDMEGDAQARKHTLASILGLHLSRILAILLLLGAYAVVVALAIPHNGPHLLLITLWTFPIFLVLLTSIVRTDTPAALHLTLREALRLETFFALLLFAAIFVTAFWPMLPHIPWALYPL